MELKELVLKNLILKVRCGSHLYGTNTSESDEDFAGIFVPNAAYLIGLKDIKSKEVDLSKIKKDEHGKNTKDAIDFKVYFLEKFIRLALKNNPNILELLFVDEKNIVFINDVGKALLDIRYEFLSKHIKGRFLEYAKSQKDKMVIKLDNYDKLNKAYDYICENEGRFRFLLELMEASPNILFVRKKDYARIGNINFPITITLKRAKAMICNRLDRYGSRQELISKYGYDTKFASNLIRILLAGGELLMSGDLKFPLKSRELILDIRYGKYSMAEVVSLANRIEKGIEKYDYIYKVPDEPNEELIEKFLITIHRKYILEEQWT